VHDDEAGAARLTRRWVGKALLYTAGVAAAVAAAASLAIPLALGEDFSDAVEPLWLLLPGVVAYAPVTILVVYLSVRRGRPELSLAVSLAGLVVTTATALFLIPRYGAAGAGAGSAVGYGAGVALAWLFFERLARHPGASPPGRAVSSESDPARRQHPF